MTCRVLRVSTSGYYEWRTRGPSARDLEDAHLLDAIIAVHADARGTYGVRRVHAELALGQHDDDSDAKPAHVVRFEQQTDAKGLLAESKDSERAVGYLCKYLTKSVADTYADPVTAGLTDEQHGAYEAHIDRLHEQVLWLPCSPECANWLRYGVQPDAVGPGLTPGM